MPAQAQLTTVAEDNFNYSDGSSLAGQSGGSGWTSGWVNDYTSGATLQVSASGLSYTGLSTGGAAVWAGGGNGIGEDSRTLPLQDSGLLYFQFLCQFGSQTGGGTPNIRLSNGGNLTGGFGANGGTYGSVISILNSGLSPATDGSSSTTAGIANVNLVVAMIDYEHQQTLLWINPDLSTFDYESPPTPDATYANLAPEFDKVSIYSRDPGTISGLQIMSVPEPSPTVLIGLGLFFLVMRRWFRRS